MLWVKVFGIINHTFIFLSEIYILLIIHNYFSQSYVWKSNKSSLPAKCIIQTLDPFLETHCIVDVFHVVQIQNKH